MACWPELIWTLGIKPGEEVPSVPIGDVSLPMKTRTAVYGILYVETAIGAAV